MLFPTCGTNVLGIERQLGTKNDTETVVEIYVIHIGRAVQLLQVQGADARYLNWCPWDCKGDFTAAKTFQVHRL